ncbi:helix-turn-helix domain-containing protein [Pseudomonas canadensis]|uniref:Helix-turn-helix domain-containing protein n=1 Tax=Pseudomonas canadensis TaxID=915099 RepID=A0ABZ0ZY54_9PSED|nr:helix-turn-helix domain-containing protein [Pseudomonas canadensis]WRI21914.1 helix-turn-helix domain-containing protein [Pseudomonas canadensis]
MPIPGNVFKAGRKTLGLTQTEVADALGVSIDTIKRWEAGKKPIPERMIKKINGLIPSDIKSADHGPVTLVIAPLGFYRTPNTEEHAEIRQEFYLKTSDAFIQTSWYLHDYPLMQAFIIDSNCNTCRSIEDIDQTIGRAVKEVYFVHTISPSTNTPTLSTDGPDAVTHASSYPDFSEALENAKKLISDGLCIALSIPNGTRLYNEEVINTQIDNL